MSESLEYLDPMADLRALVGGNRSSPTALNFGMPQSSAMDEFYSQARNTLTPAAPLAQAAPRNWWDGFTGYTDEKTQITKGGWGAPVIQGAGALASTFLGMKQYGLAKKQLKEDTRQFNLNFGAQKNLVNSQMSDRQAARVSGSPNSGFMSPDDYVAKYGVK
jgi:hypothetical protein